MIDSETFRGIEQDLRPYVVSSCNYFKGLEHGVGRPKLSPFHLFLSVTLRLYNVESHTIYDVSLYIIPSSPLCNHLTVSNHGEGRPRYLNGPRTTYSSPSARWETTDPGT